MKTRYIIFADDDPDDLELITGFFKQYNQQVNVLELKDGKEVLKFLNDFSSSLDLPILIVLDINMPRMDEFETTLWLKNTYPLVHVLALSMYDDKDAIIRMIKNGAKGYIFKNIDPKELRTAIKAVMTKGFYYSDMDRGKMLHNILYKDK